MDEKNQQLINPKLLFLLLGLLAIWLVFTAFVPEEFKPAEGAQEFLVTFKAVSGEQTILNKTLGVMQGTNAFEAMQTVATVGYQDYGEMGVMVESINGKKASENEFWALYIDGEMAATGINAVTIEKDTTIEWKIESTENYSG